jgi:hypothetical protein
MKKLMGWALMDKAGDVGGAGAAGGGDEGGDGGQPGAGNQGGGSILGGAGADGGKSGGGKGGDGKGGSILGGAGADDGGGGGEPPDAKPEEVEAFLAAVKPADLGGGDGETAPAWDADAVKAVAPYFLKHKIGGAAANEIVGAYARHVAAQFKAAADADRAVLDQMHAACAERFGGDLKRFASEARRGGEHVFGKALFVRLASVEAFGSDPDIIEALARVGRGLARDRATIGEDAGGDREERPLAERMYGASVRKK